MIELGGNIRLEGFEDAEKGSLVIIKKIVGNYVRNMQQKHKFKSLELMMKNKVNFSAKLELENKKIESKIENKNVFFGLNGVLKDVSEQLGE